MTNDPRPSPSRWLLAGGGALALTSLAAGSLRVGQTGVPRWDGADYLLRAEWLRQAVTGESFSHALDALQLGAHPPGHAALIAVVGVVAQVDVEVAARVWALLAMLLTVASGGVVLQRTVRDTPLTAAGLCLLAGSSALCWFSSSPIATSSACCAIALAALSLTVLPRDRWVTALCMGLAVPALCLIRWNLGPTLLLGLTISWVLRRGRASAPQVALLWFPPLLAGLAARALDPGLPARVLRFAVNRSSDMDLLAHLLWLPQTLLAHHGVLGATLLLGGFFVPRGMRDARAADLAFIALVGLAAAWLHPFKIPRLILPFVLLLLPAIALGVSTVLRPWHLRLGAGLLGVGALAVCHLWLLPQHAERRPWDTSPELPRAVSMLLAGETTHLHVFGLHDRLSPPWLTLCALRERPDLELTTRAPKLSTPAAYRDAIETRLRGAPDTARFVVVEPAVATQDFETYRSFQRGYAEALAESAEAVLLENEDLGSLSVAVYGVAPSAVPAEPL